MLFKHYFNLLYSDSGGNLKCALDNGVSAPDISRRKQTRQIVIGKTVYSPIGEVDIPNPTKEVAIEALEMVLDAGGLIEDLESSGMISAASGNLLREKFQHALNLIQLIPDE